MARSLTPPVEGAHHEARQKGNLNPGGGEGTWGTIGGREQVWGPGLGSLLTMLPWFPRYPNLACKHEATPCGESPEATRPDSRGHTARTLNLDDTLAHGHARASPFVRPRGHPRTHANPDRSTDPGVSTLRMSVLHSPIIVALVLGCSVEARVSEPGSGTRTLLLRVPVRKYIWGVS